MLSYNAKTKRFELRVNGRVRPVQLTREQVLQLVAEASDALVGEASQGDSSRSSSTRASSS